MKRRNFLLGALLAPFAPKVLAPVAERLLAAGKGLLVRSGYREVTLFPHPGFGDIIATTISSRSKQIADNVSRNNVLMLSLTREGKRRAALSPEERLAEDRKWARIRWREEPRWAFDRGNTVRVDSRASSGYAAWLS